MCDLLHHSLKVFEFVNMFLLNNNSQNFKLGSLLPKDFRNELGDSDGG